MIQAQIKGFVTRMRYKKDRMFRREYAARKIQARYRAYIQRKKYISNNTLSNLINLLFRDQACIHEVPSQRTDKAVATRLSEDAQRCSRCSAVHKEIPLNALVQENQTV